MSAAPCACPGRNPEDWFPAVESGAQDPPTSAGRQALAVRATCLAAIRAECLEDALAAGAAKQHGIAGGLRDTDRRALLADHKRVAV
ncbi:WhiB family transcriptional regulator [Streptomyces sp. NPDC048156]|uniref:WhiB family transcriptional regulator n=1 Tax=Streptomyces sp. NPDC048156 TaxID=3365502 RepID=UPI0037237C96